MASDQPAAGAPFDLAAFVAALDAMAAAGLAPAGEEDGGGGEDPAPTESGAGGVGPGDPRARSVAAALDAAGLAAAADVAPPATWARALPPTAAPRRVVRARGCRHRFERDGGALTCAGCGVDRADLDVPAEPPVTPPLRVVGERGALLTRNLFGSAPPAPDRALLSVRGELAGANERLRRAHGRHFRGDVLDAAAAIYAEVVSPRLTIRRGPRADALAACVLRAANRAGVLVEPADLARLFGAPVNAESGEARLRGLAPGADAAGLDGEYAAAVRVFAEARAPADRLAPVLAEAARLAEAADRREIGGANVKVRAAGAVLLALAGPRPSRAAVAAFAAGRPGDPRPGPLPGGVKAGPLAAFAAEFAKYAADALEGEPATPGDPATPDD